MTSILKLLAAIISAIISLQCRMILLKSLQCYKPWLLIFFVCLLRNHDTFFKILWIPNEEHLIEMELFCYVCCQFDQLKLIKFLLSKSIIQEKNGYLTFER